MQKIRGDVTAVAIPVLTLRTLKMNEELIEQLVVMTDQAINKYTNGYL
jgi:hypothetical protein